MNRAGALWAGAAIIGFASCVIGEPAPSSGPRIAAGTAADPAPSPRPGVGTETEGAKESPKTRAQGDYPAVPDKKLWAKTDVRGKQAPKIHAEQWLSSEPETKDKTIVLDLWATWCMPCRALIPELEAWQEKFKDDLVVIGLTNESVKDVETFHTQRGSKIKYPIARDSQGRLNKELGVSGIPHILVISSDGIVRWQGYPRIGDDRLTESVLKQIIDADKAARAKRDDAKDRKPREASPVAKGSPDEKAASEKKPDQKS